MDSSTALTQWYPPLSLLEIVSLRASWRAGVPLPALAEAYGVAGSALVRIVSETGWPSVRGIPRVERGT